MSQNMYKNLAIVLGVIIVILGVLYFMQADEPAADSLGDAAQKVEECSNRLTLWNETYGGDQESEMARAELELILTDCSEYIGEAQ